MFVGDAKLLGLKRKRCSRKIISFDAASHHATVDYYTVTASPVMFYSVRVTLCGDTRQGCALSYFLLGIWIKPLPTALCQNTNINRIRIQQAQSRLCVYMLIIYFSPNNIPSFSKTTNYFINRSWFAITLVSSHAWVITCLSNCQDCLDFI